MQPNYIFIRKYDPRWYFISQEWKKFGANFKPALIHILTSQT